MMIKNFQKIIHLFILFGSFTFNTCYEETTKDIHIFEGSDFEEVVKTSLFVDKTLLLKRFIDNTKHGSGILILTPRYFGKSTNMDMLKRFLEINVDKQGCSVNNEKTSNYNIFRNNFLNIYRLRDFFDMHFGKYPVISFDYKPLRTIKTIEEMIAVFFKKIIMNPFSQHSYLLNDTHIWTLNDTYSWVDRTRFEHYLNPEMSHKLTEKDVTTGLSFLCKLLHKKFEKRVTVLVDNYDAIVDSPLFSENPNKFHLVSAVNCDLLLCESVERSLVTGNIRPSGPKVARQELLPACVVDAVASHKVWPYYGLSGAELEALLEPVVRDAEERERVVGRIVHEYSGYSVATFEVGEDTSGQLLDTQTCSVWSVLEYMRKEMAVENFSSLV